MILIMKYALQINDIHNSCQEQFFRVRRANIKTRVSFAVAVRAIIDAPPQERACRAFSPARQPARACAATAIPGAS
jgi:hypothetical protein